MEHLVTLSGLALALLFVAMSPGPAFVVVSQQALAQSRSAGVIAALGVSVGSALWVILILLGIAVVLETAAWLYAVLRILGGAYLVYLGIRLWRGASDPMVDSSEAATPQHTQRGAFWRSILLQLLNPKAAIFFGSIFLTMLSPAAPAWVKGAALGIVFVVEFGWYLVIATTFSSRPARRAYARTKAWVERVAGAWLALFGLKLALSDR